MFSETIREIYSFDVPPVTDEYHPVKERRKEKGYCIEKKAIAKLNMYVSVCVDLYFRANL